MKLQLLGKGSTNAKLAKSIDRSYILYMTPADGNSFGVNLCPNATAGCKLACLNTAGRGSFNNVQRARLRKADWYVSNSQSFMVQLIRELDWANKLAIKRGIRIAIRLNGTTDIYWESLIDMGKYSNLQFYDYTKSVGRALRWARGELPSNYHLTFSKSEVTGINVINKLIQSGVNVAVVFGKSVPNEYMSHKVINGDKSDERYRDERGVIVGLLAKGKARKDTSGFVVFNGVCSAMKSAS